MLGVTGDYGDDFVELEDHQREVDFAVRMNCCPTRCFVANFDSN